jgi:hypothetical protein
MLFLLQINIKLLTIGCCIIKPSPNSSENPLMLNLVWDKDCSTAGLTPENLIIFKRQKNSSIS